MSINTDTDAEKTRIPTAKPELEPEYVGAFSEPVGDACWNYRGEYIEDLEKCDEPATHTVVMRESTGDLAEIAMCDNCGEPRDARRA